ncbi:hypothetical protein LGV61_00375 [Desulfurispirillum indicum]|uniref:Uncharacterized protein n=1 Tax=Desulfurispirillum indicum (strain ATCC BAA-1389 / DSM 22839 / S5) TaxID=653733 RepID=E6W4V4_DESIS|nr:hypothetical protein [Desulfurispirillum indicum]ADU64832.1 hypothetical protein Selin_0073 [Desulfurispirillum indicum S5]UCZ56766.1 hypothetical protein LGV61_00375 [Desulfurispirillum indicum]
MLGMEKIIENKAALLKGTLTVEEALELAVAFRDARNYLWNKFGSDHVVALSLDNALKMIAAISELHSRNAISGQARIGDLITLGGAFGEYLQREEEISGYSSDAQGRRKK